MAHNKRKKPHRRKEKKHMVDVKQVPFEVQELLAEIDAVVSEGKSLPEGEIVAPAGSIAPPAPPALTIPANNQEAPYDWQPYKNRLALVQTLTTTTLGLQQLTNAITVTSQHPDGTPNMDINPAVVDTLLTMVLKSLRYLGPCIGEVKALLESQSAK